MNKVLACLILGIAFTSSVLIISVTYLFGPQARTALPIVVALAFVVIVLSICAIVIRKRFADMLK